MLPPNLNSYYYTDVVAHVVSNNVLNTTLLILLFAALCVATLNTETE